MSILGNRVLRTEDPRLVRGRGRFVANLDLPEAASVVFVRSPVAHGLLRAVHTDEARTMPGVLAVVDAAGLGAQPALGFPPVPRPAYLQPRPLGDGRKVRFAGEAVAAVVAETPAQAADAAEAVWLDIDPLDPVLDPATADTNPSLLFDEMASNLLPAPKMAVETTPPDFSACEVVVEQHFVNSRMSAAPMEPRVAAAHWHDDGTLTCWSATQSPHMAQAQIAAAAGLEPTGVRVIIADVGGAFGSKAVPANEECALGPLSRLVGRPVQWVETRTENLLAMFHSRAQHHMVRIGGSRDGRITHYHLHVRADSGAADGAAGFMSTLTARVAQGCYDIAAMACTAEAVLTNTSPVGPFRGAGRPEGICAIERAVDMFAAEIGMDPAEVRRRNLIDPGAFPYTTATGSVYDSGDYEAALDKALALAGYEDLRAEQAARRERDDRMQLGIGLAAFVEISAGGPGPQTDFVVAELLAGGRFVVRCGAIAMGQGMETTMAMVAASRLGVEMAGVEVVYGDTDVIETSGITGGSRTVQITGSVTDDACRRLAEMGRATAASLLEAAAADVVLDTAAGHFHVAGTPSRYVTWADVAAASPEPATARGEFAQLRPTFPSGVNVAVVEVDTETGATEVVRMVAVDDAGVIVNPMLAEGQIHGGLGAGVAQALYEEVVYDEHGTLRTSNFGDYPVISAPELCDFDLQAHETPSPNNPLGAKGIGESGTIGSTVAVQNAVIDAVAHLGIRHLDMPLTPEKVWHAIRHAPRAGNGSQLRTYVQDCP